MTAITIEENAATIGRMPIREMAGGKKSQRRLWCIIGKLHYDNTYNDFSYNDNTNNDFTQKDFTYNTFKGDITYNNITYNWFLQINDFTNNSK